MSVSVQRFTVAGKAYFISLRRKPDLQGGSVDLEVTDGAAAWTASGALFRPPFRPLCPLPAGLTPPPDAIALYHHIENAG